MSVSGKRSKLKSTVGSEDEELPSSAPGKKTKNDAYYVGGGGGGEAPVNKSRIYNYGYRKKPAELFRKDLISCMKLPDSEQLNPDDYLLIVDTWKEEWEKGVQVPVNPDCLPEASAKLFEDRIPLSEDYKPPKKLIKSDPDADSYVSRYELDLLDVCWIKSLKESDEAIVLKEDIVEEIINELEYECATNMKAKQIGIEFNDHIICDVCRSPDAEDGNEMVFCDSCNICVHQACYGIEEIPEGEWLCRPCKELGTTANVSCVLCPNLGGAFKPTTTTSQWAHVSCALWIPEVSIGCVTSMEPITKIRQIPPTRWNLVCSICNIKSGSPIQCSVKSCKVSYHVTCAFNQKLKMKAIVAEDTNGVKLKSYCPKHSECEESNEKGAKSREVIKKSQREIEIATTSSTAEDDCENEFWKYVDINQINHKFFPMIQDEYSGTPSQTLFMYIDLIYQYWKLKRCSNYGAPLIKVVTSASLEEMQIQQKADILRLRVDLERIRNLSYMLCKREKVKRNWLRTHQETVEKALSYTTGVSLSALDNPPGSILSEVKTYHVNDEKVKLVTDIVSSSVIYDESQFDRNKPKQIVKHLQEMLRKDRFKRSRINPYAKFYFQGRRKSNDYAPTETTALNSDAKSSSLSLSSSSSSAAVAGASPVSTNKHNSNHNRYHNGTLLRPSVAHINGTSKSQPLLQKLGPSSNGLNSPRRNNNSLSASNENHRVTTGQGRKQDNSSRGFQMASAPIITRSSALVGYKIPKKKRKEEASEDEPLKGAESPSSKIKADFKLQPGKHVFASDRRSPIGQHRLIPGEQESIEKTTPDGQFKEQFHFSLRTDHNHSNNSNNKVNSSGSSRCKSRTLMSPTCKRGLFQDDGLLIGSSNRDVDMRRKAL